MGAAENIPFEERAINAEEVGVLLACSTRQVRGRYGMTQDACAKELRALIAKAGGEA